MTSEHEFDLEIKNFSELLSGFDHEELLEFLTNQNKSFKCSLTVKFPSSTNEEMDSESSCRNLNRSRDSDVSWVNKVQQGFVETYQKKVAKDLKGLLEVKKLHANSQENPDFNILFKNDNNFMENEDYLKPLRLRNENENVEFYNENNDPILIEQSYKREIDKIDKNRTRIKDSKIRNDNDKLVSKLINAHHYKSLKHKKKIKKKGLPACN